MYNYKKDYRRKLEYIKETTIDFFHWLFNVFLLLIFSAVAVVIVGWILEQWEDNKL